ncbi:efflux RND transporter periplasmic adaptor subunit [Niveibacterium sp. 24ML]|uniref:efflux RND transporter periplasmic adaptor subunit n=1 Tax=Niveibacterium sp. 24ML TaxID=2985512 RepID=UPI00226DCEF6|nr:efflux RND transporter periplasmic adaptor subunit [Niveibacterium sp. 24ML]MCX9157548.1 efflux RND transporter periplasmic adaptor subunit [Niveibacterium sp. 24ML]
MDSPQTAPSKPRSKLTRRLIVVAVLAVAVAALAYTLTRPKPIAVTVTEVQPGRVEATVSNTRAGSVTACRRAKLAPPAGGRIGTLAVKKGQRVKAGDLLLELWNDDVTARERIAREQLLSARARVNEACTVADTAAANARRAQQLRDQGFLSPEGIEQTLSEAKSRAAACSAAKAQVGEAQARIGASQADTARTVLRAPFDGIVAELNGEVGEYLTPSPPGIQTLPAVDLIDDSCLYVSAPIDEVDAARLKLGMSARITLDAFRDRHFKGTVKRIAPYVLALEKQARTAEVEVHFTDTADTQALLIGYSADVDIIVTTHDPVLRVPTAAVMPGNRVLVLGSDGVLKEVTFSPGLSNWEFTEVASGLAKGDRIVTSLDRAGVKAGAKAEADLVRK